MKLDFFLRQQRDRELCRDYRNTKERWIKEGIKFSDKELLMYVLENCRPHYHFSFEYARRMLKSVGIDGLCLCKSTLHQAMWQEIAEKVKLLCARFPKKTLTGALSEVLADERASRYFLTYNYAKRIVNEIHDKSNHLRRA